MPIALGYTMVYGIRSLNFAHGEVYMMGAFAGYGMLTVFVRALAVDQRRCPHRTDAGRSR